MIAVLSPRVSRWRSKQFADAFNFPPTNHRTFGRRPDDNRRQGLIHEIEPAADFHEKRFSMIGIIRKAAGFVDLDARKLPKPGSLVIMRRMQNAYSDVGNTNLQVTEKANRFVDWMYAEVKPFLRGSILEIGSGLGVYSDKIAADFPDQTLTLSDVDERYLEALKSRFSGRTAVRVRKLDLASADDIKGLESAVDSVVALNVLEHINDDLEALRNVYAVLKPGGRFVVLVPAHPWLFNCIDRAIGHERRYTKKSLKALVAQTPFRVEKLFYFTALSIAGWIVNGSILKHAVIHEGSLKIFDRLVPILAWTEKHLLRRSVGISLIAVLEK